jgi:polysaccharide transporter, PST family
MSESPLVSAWVLSFIMVAKAKTKLYVITEILFSALFVAFSLFFISTLGIVGGAIAYMINYFIIKIF